MKTTIDGKELELEVDHKFDVTYRTNDADLQAEIVPVTEVGQFHSYRVTLPNGEMRYLIMNEWASWQFLDQVEDDELEEELAHNISVAIEAHNSTQ